MENNHNYLDLLFGYFCAYFEFDWEGYREAFLEHYSLGRVEVSLTKRALETALSDSEFKWKEFLYWLDFFLYDEKKTNNELIMDFKILFWDVLFPEQIISEDDQVLLKKESSEILSKHNALSEKGSMDIDKLIFYLQNSNKKWAKIDYYEILRMQKYIAPNEIGLKHDIGADKWWLYLVFQTS